MPPTVNKLLDVPMLKAIIYYVVAILIAWGIVKSDISVLSAKYDFIQTQIMDIKTSVEGMRQELSYMRNENNAQRDRQHP